MNAATHSGLRNALRWGLALYTLIAAGLMIVQTLAIYRTGMSEANLSANGVYLQDVYSREIVAEHFAAIALPMYGWLAAAALALAGSAALRPKTSKIVTTHDPLDRMLRLLGRVPSDVLAGEGVAAQTACRERRRIQVYKTELIVLGLLSLTAALLYLAFQSPFGSRELEPVMGNLLIHLLPLAALVMVAACIAAARLNVGAQRALPAVQPLAAGARASAASRGIQPHAAGKSLARTILYVLAVSLIIWGILNQGMRDVLIKAINICTECVGLG